MPSPSDPPTSPPPELSPNLLPRYQQELRLRHYAQSTIKTYTAFLRSYLSWIRPKHPREADDDDIKAFLLAGLEVGCSRSWLDQAISALKFLYVALYDRAAAPFAEIVRPRREQKLPDVPTRGQVICLTDQIQNRKHRLAVLLLYASGLRVSEVVALKVGDVLLEERLIKVRESKGAKDRLTLLSPALVDDLEWVMAGRPLTEPLIPSVRGGHLNKRSVQHVVSRARAAAALPIHVTCHSLRHAFATHLLEAGTELRFIQILLGHRSIVTTTRYTQMRNPNRLAVRSPL